MAKTILITGATDGIGRVAAEMLLKKGHHLILHGRNSEKLELTTQELKSHFPERKIEVVKADLSKPREVRDLSETIVEKWPGLEVLVNNAGVFKTSQSAATGWLDVRFMVNTISPYFLSRQILERIPAVERIVNVASAAQAPVNLAALRGERRLEDFEAYAQSKLALIMWTGYLAKQYEGRGKIIVSVNPGSLLGTKMVREGFGMPGKDVDIGGEILTRAAVGDEFANANGKYYDNDARRFGKPHPDAMDFKKIKAVVSEMDAILNKIREQ